MSEQIGFVLVLAGLFAATAGLVWTILRSLAVLLRRREMRKLVAPLALLAAGLVVGGLPFAWQRIHLAVVGLGERERVIDGERAITLTGWDREGYGILVEKPDVAILEMGNADVTDATLTLLEGLPNLRELTLNDSSITDEGLATLSRLPKLETLRIARTHVTPEGMRRFLDSPPRSLRQIDVSGNGIPTAILREWKNAGAADGEGSNRRYVN